MHWYVTCLAAMAWPASLDMGYLRRMTEHHARIAQLRPTITADAYSDLGAALSSLGAPVAAAEAYTHAIRAAPRHAVAYSNLAALFSHSPGRRPEALRLYLASYTMQPGTYSSYPQMHLNLAGVLVDTARYDEARWHYERGLRYEIMQDDTLGRLAHLGQRVCDWRGVARAWPALRRSVALVQRQQGRGASSPSMRPALSPMHALTLPLTAAEFVALSAAHTSAIASFVAMKRLGHAHPEPPLGLLSGGVASCDNSSSGVSLHIGFVSSDFRQHPVAILLASALNAMRVAFQQLRVSLFALNPIGTPIGEAGAACEASKAAEPRQKASRGSCGYAEASGGADAKAAADEWVYRLRASADAMVPLHGLDDVAAAALIHGAKLHVLIDLNGIYSRGARPGLLAARPAPLQGTHLGFGASTGAPFLDLVLGDRTALPVTRGNSRWFTERFVLLPDSHLPSGHRDLVVGALADAPLVCCARAISPASCHARGRARFRLPPSSAHPTGVVYAYLGQHLKVDDQSFVAWMSLLRTSPRSVLWLLAWPGSMRRLRLAAAEAGVHAASRLVFTDRQPQGEHLCAFRLADLALDPPTYSSGATGIDVLWAGVPLLVMPGGMQPDALADVRADRPASWDFPSVFGVRRLMPSTIFQRNSLSLAASALQPDLRAVTWQSYEALGRDVMARAATRRALRHRARDARHEAPLFDTGRWARGYGDGVRAAWATHSAGGGVMHMVVARTGHREQIP